MHKHILAKKETNGLWSLYQCIGDKTEYSMIGVNFSTVAVQEEAFRIAEQWEKATNGSADIEFDCRG